MFGLTPWKKTQNRNWLPARRTDYPVNRLREEFDSLFDRFFGNWPAPFEPGWGFSPAWGMDVEESDHEFVVRTDAPGFEPDDFDIQVNGDWLTVRAETRKEGKEEGGDYAKGYRRFERSVTLPAGTDLNKVEARYRNGVLEVHLPKSPEAQPKRIEVKA